MITWKNDDNQRYITFNPDTNKIYSYSITGETVNLSIKNNINFEDIVKVLESSGEWVIDQSDNDTNSILNWDLFQKMNGDVKIDTEYFDEITTLCPECFGCGQEGCCSPLNCTMKGSCGYRETNLQHLKFGYRMYNYMEEEIIPHLPLDVQDKITERWDEIYDKVYR
jgi:hypothetical protein